jgi:two-component system, NarL family, sensor kinase
MQLLTILAPSEELAPWFPLLVGSSVLLALALAIIIFVLQYQKRLLQQQENLRQVREGVQQQLLEAALEAQEHERRRIGRDLHDDIGATLSVVKLHLNAWQDPQPDGPASQAKELLNGAVGELRRISRELLPVMLDKFGLVKALESLAKTVPASAEVEVRFTCSGEVRPLPPRLELIAYRVVQELLNNALKHAEADIIRIDLAYEPGALRLFFADDGKGFAYSPNQTIVATDKPGLGLFNLQSRVSLAQGTLYFLSAPDEGTQAALFLPIP